MNSNNNTQMSGGCGCVSIALGLLILWFLITGRAARVIDTWIDNMDKPTQQDGHR